MYLTYDEIIAVAQKTRTAESQSGDYVLPLSFANEIIAANDARAAVREPAQLTSEEHWPAPPAADGEISGVRYFNLYTLREYGRTLLAQASSEHITRAVIDQIIAQVSALPLLFPDGCKEPGALLRNTEVMDVLLAASRAAQRIQAAPVAYVRQHPDGTLTEDYLSAARIEPVRVNCGAWLPLGIIGMSAAMQAQLQPAAEGSAP